MKQEEQKKMSQNLKSALKKSGVSAMDLSRKLEVHYDTIMKWLAGSNTGYLKRLEEICEILKIDVTALFPTSKERPETMNKDQEIIYLRGRVEYLTGRIDQLERIITSLARSGSLNFSEGSKKNGTE